MKHVVPHDLGQEKARKAADAAFRAYTEKFSGYSPQANWVTPNRADISFNVKGMKLNGSLEVLERSIEMDLDVPFLLRPFKGTALGVIEGEIKTWLAKAKAGEV